MSDKESRLFPKVRLSSRLPIQEGLGAALWFEWQDRGLLELHLCSKHSGKRLKELHEGHESTPPMPFPPGTATL